MPMTLKAARINKNLTRKQAAEKIGVSLDTIGNWERGKTFPGVGKIKQIESAYNIHYDEIIFLPSNTL